LLEKRDGGVALGRFRVPYGEVRERRPMSFASLDERERRESGVVAGEQALQQGVLGEMRLNDDLAGAIGAARAAGDLQDRLREPLVTARIRAEQALVGIQDADQRDARKIVAFRQHLRADQDLGVADLDVVQHGRERAFAARAVAIEACDARSGEQRGQLVADALRAGADGDPLPTARAAGPVERPFCAAVMAADDTRLRVHRHASVAAPALLDLLALGAKESRREAAPIKEQQYLIAGLQVLLDGGNQRRLQRLSARVTV
jgi:hypothetical protein